MEELRKGREGQGLHSAQLLSANKIGPIYLLTILVQDLLKDLCKLSISAPAESQGSPLGAAGSVLGQVITVWAMEIVVGLD